MDRERFMLTADLQTGTYTLPWSTIDTDLEKSHWCEILNDQISSY